MKKIYLGILILFSIMSFAYDYSHAYDSITPDLTTHKKVNFNIKRDSKAGLAIFNFNGLDFENEITTLKQKALIPKEVDSHRILIFHHPNPEYMDTKELDKLYSDSSFVSNIKEITIEAQNHYLENNIPLFAYIYDYNISKIHKIYLEDGSRFVYRQILSESTYKITPENLANKYFSFGYGYIEARDLYKFQIGEIKAKDRSQSIIYWDRSQHGVTGETVYNYIKNEKDKANLENPTGSLVTDKQVKEYIEKMLKKLLESKK